MVQDITSTPITDTPTDQIHKNVGSTSDTRRPEQQADQPTTGGTAPAKEQDKNQAKDKTKDDSQDDAKKSPYFVPYTILLLGLLFLLLAFWNVANWKLYWTAVGIGLLIAGGATLTGGLIGFLFGLPRKIAASASASSSGSDDSYDTNTNLEQISDWLTKILLGAGLTQAGSIVESIGSLANQASKNLPGVTEAPTIFVAEFVYFTIAGFLAFYLWTRVEITQAFSEFEALRRKLKAHAEEDQKTKYDAAAIAAVKRLLDDAKNKPTATELKTAIAAASSDVRALIFFRAQKERIQNERDDAARSPLERAIQVFQALADSDIEKIYHANYGEIGLAQKALSHCEEALPNFTEAITRRDRCLSGTARAPWYFYEGARAICRIRLDQDFKEGRLSSDGTRDLILSDLSIALRGTGWSDTLNDAADWLDKNGQIWMKQNAVCLPNRA